MSSSSEPARFSPIEPLRADHLLDGFDCGHPELNIWLTKHALHNQGAGGARTLVIAAGGRVVGFYALAAGAVARIDVPPRVATGMAAHPVPVIVLARMGVALSMRRKGLGRALLKDALTRALQVSEVVGVRAVLVHAKDDDARSFYESFGFEPSPVDAYQLMMLIKDIKASL